MACKRRKLNAIYMDEGGEMYNQVDYHESYSPCFNSFDKREETTNVREIKALLSVQNDAVSEILKERQKHIVMRVICEDTPQKVVAKELGITPSALCRELHLALNKLRVVLRLCQKALRYYMNTEETE